MYGNRKKRDVDEIRTEIVNHFRPMPLSDLLKMEKLESVDPVFEKLESFVEKNVRGISSTQLRNLADLVGQQHTRKTLNMQRPRMAHMIAKQPREGAQFIMILADELAAQADDITVNGYPYFVKCLLAFHKFHDVMGLRRIKKENLVSDVERDLRPITIDELLNLSEQNINKVFEGIQGFLELNSTGVTSTQLRNIYDKMNGLSLRQMKLHKPVLAYTAARQSKPESIKLITLIIELLNRTDSEKTFTEILMTIVSFHKFQETLNSQKINPGQLVQQVKAHFAPYKMKELLHRENESEFAKIQEKIQGFSSKSLSGIKPSQFRRLYDKALDAKTLLEVKKIRPLLLYTAARQKNSEAIKFILFLSSFLWDLKTEEEIFGYKNLLIDLMAYQRFFDSSNEKSIKNFAI